MSKLKKQSKARFSIVHEKMIRAVVNFSHASENVDTTQSVVAFYALMLVIKDNLSTIDTLRSEIARPITGFAAQTNALKTTLSQTSAKIMRTVCAYAIEENDQVLANAMQTTTSALNKMKNVQLVQHIQGAINTVTPLIGNLNDYNVTDETISKWKTLCFEFNNSISNPKNAIANRESINNDIQQLLRESMSILYNECDALALQFTDINSGYYNNYKANRRLNPTHLSTQLRVHVTNESNAPVTAGEVFLVGTDKNALLNNCGYALLDKIPFGNYTVAVTTPFGTHSFGPIKIKKGQSLTQHVQITDKSLSSRAYVAATTGTIANAQKATATK